MRRVLYVVLLLALVVPIMSVNVFASTGDDDFSFWDILDGIGGFFEWLADSILNGLKSLFIPHADYFPKVQDRLQDKLGEKFGGALSTIKYLQQRFKDMKAYPNLNKELTLKFPQDHLLSGVSINLIKDIPEVLSFFRGAFSGFIVLLTAAFVYRKTTKFVNT